MISVIIPVLNEERGVVDLLNHVRGLPGNKEILVVDGGSEDDTCWLARAVPDVQVIAASRGRGTQIEAGAQAAQGPTLLILHADCRLPQDALVQIAQLQSQGGLWGWFDLRYQPCSRPLAASGWVLNCWRRLLGDPRGDNAMFVTKEAWRQVGGCGCVPLMEDVALASRLRRLGRGVCLRGPVLASPRRLQRAGILRTWVLCASLYVAYRLGASPESLARFYAHVR
jgi:rSAM/selenodomain-associated transferase 2